MKRQTKKHILILVVLLVVCSISIGYSAFGSKLLIGDMVAYVRVKEDIRVSGNSLNNTTNGASVLYDDYNIRNISMGINLPNANSTVSYKVQVTNIGNVEMGILNITNLPSNLDYELSGYQLQDKLCDSNNKCSLGIMKEFILTIKYKNGGYSSSNTTYNLKLDFDFKDFVTISYKDITNEGYPTEVMNGGNVTISFKEEIEEVDVTMGGIVLTKDADYTYQNNTLTISNVTDNLEIAKKDTSGLPSGKHFEVTFRDQGGGVTGEYSYAISLANITDTPSTSWHIYIVVPPDIEVSSYWGCTYKVENGILILSNISWNGSLPAHSNPQELLAVTFKTSDPSVLPLKYTALME